MAQGCLRISDDRGAGDEVAEMLDGVATHDIDFSTNSWGNGVNATNCEIYGDYEFLAYIVISQARREAAAAAGS